MQRSRRSRPLPLLVTLVLILVANWPAPSLSASDPAPAAVAPATQAPVPSAPPATPITDWLQLGPITAPLPAFNDDKEKGYKVQDLLESGPIAVKRLPAPAAGRTVTLPAAGPLAWRAVTGPKVDLDAKAGGGGPAEAYLAVWLDASRWLPAELTLTSPHPAQAFLDGKAVSFKEKEAAAASAAGDTAQARPQAAGQERAARTASLKLVPGKHLLLVHAVWDPQKKEPWRVDAAVSAGKEMPAGALAATLDPRRTQDIHDVLDTPAITSAAISPDGRLVLCSLAAIDPDGKRDSWLEVRRVSDGGTERSWRGGARLTGAQWDPKGQRLSYVNERDGKSTIWIHDLAAGTTTPLVTDVEHLGAYRWSPDGSFIVYELGKEPEPDKRKVKRLQNLADRDPSWRDRSWLVMATVPDGTARRLTAGPWSTGNWRIAPDARRLLFFREWPDYTARPYTHSELWEIDLRTLAAQKILEDPWIASAEYGPDPNVLALQGSPSAFDGLGRKLPAGVQANDYTGELYLYDRAARKATAASRDFDPDIQSLAWSRSDGRIYAQVIEKQLQSLYAFDPRSRAWTRLDSGVEVMDDFDLALQAPLAVALGSSATAPQRLSLIDLKRGSARVILEPGAEALGNLRYGRVEDWPARLPDGELLDGRIYYPVDFDPSRRYPCIVYYYGGTTPVGRDYGGRYPKNVWAGQGYFVYVPQPSGAEGYGQEFAARHVNDWGIRTAQEVIDGTKAFLAAHPYVDPKRLACIGASYGGFLTELLVTKTDMFACAISHAGISSIASYWGEGYWGYDYGARALANAFPWSNRDLYVGQSALFSADKITTPLLLLHGSVDTNVPTGESDQLYTALKLLGRPVEYVKIEGQNHHVLDHDQRIVWNDTILAWFAKWLKDQPQWWQELYPQ